MLVLDISGSMLAQDLQPKNRLETAKSVLKDFIISQKLNKVGLIVFAGSSFTLSPLTLDHNILIELLENITIDNVKFDGTAIGDALTSAIYRISQNNNSEETNKIIILLTDGENNVGFIDPIEASLMAKIKKIKIYTIGIGKPGVIKVPFVYKETLFENKSLGITKFNEKLLKQIAFLTNGKYYNATDKNKLQKIYNEISNLEKYPIKIKHYKQIEKYHYFLIPAIILFILEFILTQTILRVI